MYPCAVNCLDRLCRDTPNNCMRRHVFCDHSPCRNDRTFPNSYTIRDDRARPEPDIIFDHDALCSNSLLHEGTCWITKDMLDRDHLRERRGIYTVTNLHAALSPDN